MRETTDARGLVQGCGLGTLGVAFLASGVARIHHQISLAGLDRDNCLPALRQPTTLRLRESESMAESAGPRHSATNLQATNGSCAVLVLVCSTVM